jgi:hypothetical protein
LLLFLKFNARNLLDSVAQKFESGFVFGNQHVIGWMQKQWR